MDYRQAALSTALFAFPFSAQASCGAAFCSVNTTFDVQGAWTEPGARLDLRYESINQNQPRSGSAKVGVGQIPRHHECERRPADCEQICGGGGECEVLGGKRRIVA